MFTGNIILSRAEKTFIAAYCVVREGLGNLVEHCSFLDLSERAYYDGLKFDKQKHSYLLGRLVAKKAVTVLIDERNISSIVIDYGVFYFPVVKDVGCKNIQVCVAHCDDKG